MKNQINELIQLVADVEDLGTLICAERVHEVDPKQVQQATELKKAIHALTKVREEIIKKAPENNLVFDRVENSFEGLGLPIIHQWSVSNTEVVIEGRKFRPKNPDKAVVLLKSIDKAQKNSDRAQNSSPSSPHYFAILDKIKKLVKRGENTGRSLLCTVSRGRRSEET